MTPDESFNLYLSKQDHAGLPWQTPVDEVRAIFMAGWAARDEAAKQTTLFSPEPFSVKAESAITAETIYAAWPVKKARGAAIPAITKALKKVDGAVLLKAVRDLAAAYAKWPAAERQYLPMCSTFMNQERWLDDPATWQRGAIPTGPSIRTVN